MNEQNVIFDAEDYGQNQEAKRCLAPGHAASKIDIKGNVQKG